MSAIPYCDDVLDRSVSLLQLADVAKQLGIAVTRVHQLLRDHRLLAVKRDGVLGVPVVFFGEDGAILRGLPGLIAVLQDGGYQDHQILQWMFREDETLPGAPIDAMHGHQAREVVRRAQALGF